MSKVTPFLMFNDQLEAAMEFYATTFPDSEIKNVARTGEDGGVPPSTGPQLNGQIVLLPQSMNGRLGQRRQTVHQIGGMPEPRDA